MENIDLTMLARAAYKAILKTVEEPQKDEEELHAAKEVVTDMSVKN